MIITAGILFVGLLCVYFIVDPAKHEFIPKCPMKMLTGWDCPSCGNQRAVHALLHGNLRQAIAFNFFAVYSVPYFLAVLACCFVKSDSSMSCKVRSIILSPTAAYIYIALYILWWVLRNILF